MAPKLLRGLERCLTRALFRSQRRAAKQLGVFRGGTYVALPPPTQRTVKAVLTRMLKQARRAFAAHAEAWPEDAFEGLQRQGAQERLSLGDAAAPSVRGPIAEARLSQSDDGRYCYQTKKGVCLVLTAAQLMRRLLWLIPPARFHLTSFHGVFSSHAAARSAVVPAPTPAPVSPRAPSTHPPKKQRRATPRLGHPPRADLGRRRLALSPLLLPPAQAPPQLVLPLR